MKSTDKFLIGIVAGIVVLVVVALVLTLTQPEESYWAEDTPEGVIHNYLLVLQKGDYGRAYGYLSTSMLPGLPETVDEFVDDIQNAEWEFHIGVDSSLSVQEAEMLGSGRADVGVRESSYSGGGLFEPSPFANVFKMKLLLKDGQWKIINGDRYFLWCWREVNGCFD